MRNKTYVITLLIAFVAGVFLAPLFQGVAGAYGEKDGLWTANEKKQVISLLRQIRDNTNG